MGGVFWFRWDGDVLKGSGGQVVGGSDVGGGVVKGKNVRGEKLTESFCILRKLRLIQGAGRTLVLQILHIAHLITAKKLYKVLHDAKQEKSGKKYNSIAIFYL